MNMERDVEVIGTGMKLLVWDSLSLSDSLRAVSLLLIHSVPYRSGWLIAN